MMNTAQTTTIITDLDTIKSLMQLEDLIDHDFEVFDKYKRYLADAEIRRITQFTNQASCISSGIDGSINDSKCKHKESLY